jgi:predicted glycosyltransferase
MRYLFDINHPAHVHFFHHPIRRLRSHGHDILITSRHKDVTIDLLNELGFEHTPLSGQSGGGILHLGYELLSRDFALWQTVRKFKPDAMASIGGTFIAHVGRLTGIPALIFYDTENASLQNAITYPFAARVYLPRCYRGRLPKRHARYPGYHELSYLHPKRFQPDREHAIANGLAADGATFLIRLLSWQANHDIGEQGWSPALLQAVVERLSPHGRVLISAEGQLPDTFQKLRYRGSATALHHVMAFCRLYVGESATMASECAVLGVPAIYAAHTGRGYTDEQERRYGLVRNVRRLDTGALRATIDDCLQRPLPHWREARRSLLDDTIDVAAFVTEAIESYPSLPDACLPT